MRKRVLVYVAAVVVTFAAGAWWASYAPMSAAQAQEGTSILPLRPDPETNPAVACTPYAYTTEMEEDPFETDKIRRTRTKVASVVVVFADGSTKVQKVGAK